MSVDRNSTEIVQNQLRKCSHITTDCIHFYSREQVKRIESQESSDGGLEPRRRMVTKYQFEKHDKNGRRVRRMIDPQRYYVVHFRRTNAFVVKYPTEPKSGTHALKHIHDRIDSRLSLMSDRRTRIYVYIYTGRYFYGYVICFVCGE